MNKLILFVFIGFITFPVHSWGEDSGNKRPKTFNTVFDKVKRGSFEGTVNGVLMLESMDGKQIILDFQGSKADLRVVPDQDEIYDVRYKKYAGLTTSGKTKIFYSTYARANEIGVILNNVEYSKSNLDGCSCELIEGIRYRYIQEDRNEYLVLNINKAIPLSNWQYLLRNAPNPGHENIKELRKKERIYTIQPASVVVFAIRRT